MCTISSFRSIENKQKHGLYRGKGCIKKFCVYLRQHAMKIILFKKKKLKLLIKEQQESYENANICYICREKLENKYLKDKKHLEVRDYCHYTGKYYILCTICDLKYSVPKKISLVFHNGSFYKKASRRI